MKLPDYNDFMRLNHDERMQMYHAVEQNAGFTIRRDGDDFCKLPLFEHNDSGITARLVFGGGFSMGLSDVEEQAARQISSHAPLDVDRMRPVHYVYVPSLLVSDYPILPKQYEGVTGAEYRDSSRPNGNPVRVTHDDARRFAANVGGRLLQESEWEYCCRGHSTTLFFFGNSLPEDDTLERLVRNDFDADLDFQPNAFGFFGLFSGEWCADEYVPNYGPHTDSQAGTRTVRGGASELWPWQGDDWIWCVSANRSSVRMSQGVNVGGGRILPATLFNKQAFRVAWEVS